MVATENYPNTDSTFFHLETLSDHRICRPIFVEAIEPTGGEHRVWLCFFINAQTKNIFCIRLLRICIRGSTSKAPYSTHVSGSRFHELCRDLYLEKDLQIDPTWFSLYWILKRSSNGNNFKLTLVITKNKPLLLPRIALHGLDIANRTTFLNLDLWCVFFSRQRQIPFLILHCSSAFSLIDIADSSGRCYAWRLAANNSGRPHD